MTRDEAMTAIRGDILWTLESNKQARVLLDSLVA